MLDTNITFCPPSSRSTQLDTDTHLNATRMAHELKEHLEVALPSHVFSRADSGKRCAGATDIPLESGSGEWSKSWSDLGWSDSTGSSPSGSILKTSKRSEKEREEFKRCLARGVSFATNVKILDAEDYDIPDTPKEKGSCCVLI